MVVVLLAVFCFFDEAQSVFKNPKFCSLLLGAVEKELNQAVGRHAAYSRGTGGGPPTPLAPGKFFNDRTLNAQTLNDQTLKFE